MKPATIHTFITTAAAIAGYLIVAGTTGSKILAATAATDKLIGTTDKLGAEASSPTGIALDGVGEVRLGGTVALGDFLTADSSSKAITAAASNSTNKWTIGQALAAGDADDIIPYRIAPGIFGKPSA